MSWGTTEAGIVELGRRRVLAGGAVLDVRGETAWVEGSVPRILRGANFPAGTVEEAKECGAAWMEEASSFVEWCGLARVNRLDVVRDFDVSSVGRPSEILSAVASVPVTLRATKAHYRSPEEAQAQTVWVRTKRSGGGRLYDKGQESGLTEAAGVVRYEAEERKAGLRRHGVELLALVRPEPLEDLARDRFAWCGFDRPFSSTALLMGRVWGSEELTEGMRLQLLGFYSLRSVGIGAAIEPRRAYRLRKLAASFGWPTSGAAFRLDLDDGLIAA